MFKSQKHNAVKLLESALTLLKEDDVIDQAHYMRQAELLRTLMAYARLNPHRASEKLEWLFALMCRYLDPFDVIIRGQIAEILICDKRDALLGLKAIEIARAVHVTVFIMTERDDDLATREVPAWLFLDVLEREARQIQCIFSAPCSPLDSPVSHHRSRLQRWRVGRRAGRG